MNLLIILNNKKKIKKMKINKETKTIKTITFIFISKINYFLLFCIVHRLIKTFTYKDIHSFKHWNYLLNNVHKNNRNNTLNSIVNSLIFGLTNSLLAIILITLIINIKSLCLIFCFIWMIRNCFKRFWR